MITVYSDQHFLRNARTELYGGELVPPHECAQRAEIVLERVKSTRLGEVVAPARFGLRPGAAGPRPAVRRVPAHRMERLARCRQPRRGHSRLLAGAAHDAAACRTPSPASSATTPWPAETSISAGTWEAACASADVALTAASLLARGERARLRAVPAARAPRGARSVRRLLLSQQRGDRRAISARPSAPSGWRYWTWTFITATARRTSSTIARTCCIARCTAIRRRRFRTFPAMPMKSAAAREPAST